MSKYTLPPAGTSEYPFVGNFDGNEVVLKGLTISNKYSELTDVPSGANQSSDVLSNAEIVGFFGIIGEYSATASKTTTTEVTDETTGVKTTTYVNATDGFKYNVKSVVGEDVTYINAVNDLYFENLTVKSNASKVLAGFIAGYANGQIDNCGVQCGQFSFKDGVSNFSDSVLTESSLSKYALIGDCTTNLNWKNRPGTEPSGGESGNSWGSSLNMETLFRRMIYMQASYDKYENSGTATNWFQSTRFNLSVLYSATKETYWDDNGSGIMAYPRMTTGTYLPISIDTAKAFASERELTGSEAFKDPKDSTTYNFHITDFYDSGTNSESSIIATNNSGYFVGGGELKDGGVTSTNYLYTRRQKVGSALSNAGLSGKTQYDKSKVTIRSVSPSKSEAVMDLKTNDFDYVRANDVINEFNETMADKYWVHGLRFFGSDDFESDTSDYVEAKINGKTYSKYQFMKTAINFTVKKSGYITVLLCTYNSKTMFNLYKVTRNGCSSTSDCTDEHSIATNGLTEIKTIYRYQSGTDSKGNATYSYDYNQDNHSGTKVFDSSIISPSTSNALYYFEIPVNAGDYVIGKNGTGNTGFITYLDIGTDGSEGSEQQETTDPLPTNIDFVYKNEGSIVKITDNGYAPSGVTFALSGSTTSSSTGFGWLYFKRNTSTGGVFFYIETGYSVQSAGTGTFTSKASKEEYDAATA